MSFTTDRRGAQRPLHPLGGRASCPWHASVLSLSAAMLLPSAAWAQDAVATPAAGPQSESPATVQAQAPGNPAAAADGGGAGDGSGSSLGDVVVTARRVSERLQDIPASVVAVGEEQASRLSSLDNLQSAVSGLTFKSFGPIPAVGLRGFGNRANTQGPNSTVGIFQDGVFIAPFLSALTSRIDVARVEVAKGPQSTLYGRSSYTGAINIVTNDPASTLSGYVDAGIGGSSSGSDELLWRVRGAISGPITDTLSARVFALREKRDGYTYDPVSGFRGYGYDRKIGRVKLQWEPSDAWRINLAGTLMRDDSPRGDVQSGTILPPLGQRALSGNPGIVPTYLRGPDIWRTTLAREQLGRVNGQQATLDVRYKTSIGEIASLSDYTHSDTFLRSSPDLSTRSITDIFTVTDERRFSQELRLSGDSNGLSYIAGLYYLHTDFSFGNPGATVDRSAPFITLYAGSLLYDIAGVQAVYTPFRTKTTAYAAFAQLGYDLTDRLNVTVGLRQARDELSGDTLSASLTRAGALVTTVPLTFRKADFDATTGSANLSYKISPESLVYASYSRGNSPGGFNSGGAALINFTPQTVNAYEVGLKSELLDRRVRLNAALFQNDYQDLQFFLVAPINGINTQVTLNAAKGRGRGVDIDATAVLTNSLRLNVQYTYQVSKITDYALPAPPAPQLSFVGVPLVRSPRHSLNTSLTFSHDIGPGKFQLTAEESYSSSYINDYSGAAAGTPFPGRPGVPPGVTTSQVLYLLRTPGYAITNLNASYAFGDWEISGSMRNVFNKQYLVLATVTDAFSFPDEVPGEPRTFEISLKRSF